MRLPNKLKKEKNIFYGEDAPYHQVMSWNNLFGIFLNLFINQTKVKSNFHNYSYKNQERGI